MTGVQKDLHKAAPGFGAMAVFRLYPPRQGADPCNGLDVGSSPEQGDGVAVSVLLALLTE